MARHGQPSPGGLRPDMPCSDSVSHGSSGKLLHGGHCHGMAIRALASSGSNGRLDFGLVCLSPKGGSCREPAPVRLARFGAARQQWLHCRSGVHGLQCGGEPRSVRHACSGTIGTAGMVSLGESWSAWLSPGKLGQQCPSLLRRACPAQVRLAVQRFVTVWQQRHGSESLARPA